MSKLSFPFLHRIMKAAMPGALAFRHYSSVSPVRFAQAAAKCWRCGIEQTEGVPLFCDKCNVVQNPQFRDNYFNLLGIDETYDINASNLTQKFRDKQRLLHPDKFSNRTEQERNISAEYSSLLNIAYMTLQSPINRGLHLLSLKGESIKEGETASDPEFLTEIMEMNEKVEEAETPERLLELNKQNRKMIDDVSREVSVAFQNGDLEGAKKAVIKMKYYVSIDTYINNLLRERGVVE